MDMTKKRRLILTAGVITLGVNLTTLFAGTWAWFNANKAVTATEMVVRAKDPNNVQIVSKRIYGWNYTTDTPEETNSFKLEPFDCFITSRNQYARKFVRLGLRYPNGISANTSLSIAVECTGNLYYTKNSTEYVDTKISNLIQFKYFDNKNGDIHTTDVDTIFTESTELFKTIPTSSTFVTVSGTKPNQTASKPNNTIVNTDVELDSTSDLSFETELFIEYTYNDTLLNYYQDNAEVDFDLSVFTGATTVDFDADITQLSLDLQTL